MVRLGLERQTVPRQVNRVVATDQQLEPRSASRIRQFSRGVAPAPEVVRAPRPRKGCEPVGVLVALVVGLALTTAGHALAQGKAKGKGRVVTISEVTIVGRVQKPIAAVDVSRIQPKLTLGEMKQPFLKRIEEAISREPF